MRTPASCLLLLLSLGCTVGSSVANGRATIVPRALGAEAVAKFQGQGAVAVVGGLAKDAWFVIDTRDGTQANLKVWTDETAAFVARELPQRDCAVDAGAKKRLEITVIEVTGEVGFTKARVNVRLRVQTGDGGAAQFSGSTSSMRGFVFCSEDALSQAVQQMLCDARVRAYLDS